MKVVLFCGGLGMRIREYSDRIPKPMIPIGYRPILWHIMKYYAHFGVKDFILCLGYQADIVKNYFLNYNECISNDFVLSDGGHNVRLLNSDISDWRITFVDTGMSANIGTRLWRVREHLEGEEIFLANYSDAVTDMHLPSMIEYARRKEAVATMLAVRPSQSFHLLQVDRGSNLIDGVQPINRSDLLINAGFFVLRQEIFDYMNEGEELVEEPFSRLIEKRALAAYPYNGFFMAMDTFKEKQLLDDEYSHGNAKWMIWSSEQRNGRRQNANGNGTLRESDLLT